MDIVLETGAEDLQAEDEFFEVQTSLESFDTVRKALVAENLEIENASLQWIAKNIVNIGRDEAEKVMKLIEALEESDDVQNVYSNSDFDEDMIKQQS
jgi:transcriptional/translational regulatory protein YebC/TACO1